jgi:nickel-dependent lactate racemase
VLLFEQGSPQASLTRGDLRSGLARALDALGPRTRVLALPPDFTRVHSQAGLLTELVWDYFGERLRDVLPATGTHVPMTQEEIRSMFGRVPPGLFRNHAWTSGLTALGEVPSSFIREASEGRLDYAIPVQVDRLLGEGGHDLVLSLGQVVPHEVIGMANHNKNVFVGAGGAEAIHKTHYLGAVYGMERIMGRADTPVRRVLDYASEHFARHLPIVYVLTVVGRDEGDGPAVRGLFIGDDAECFRRAALLALRVNVELVDRPVSKFVVYLDPAEFKSTWLGNKSIYRTRMAIADGGELVVLAPGISRFGEDPGIDALIRKYGYAGMPAVLELVRLKEDLKRNLAAAAHLIHGSSEGRFTVTYAPGRLSREDMEGVHFKYAPLAPLLERYDPRRLTDGFQTLPDGEEIYFVSQPGLGLWAGKGRFAETAPLRADGAAQADVR